MKSKEKMSIESKVFAVSCIIFMLLGIVLAVFAMQTVRNYFEPYKFSIIIGVLSIICGIILTRYIKTLLILNREQLNNFYLSYLYICIGLFGIMLLIANKINHNILSAEICDNYKILKKELIDRNGRYSSDDFILYLDFGNKIEKVLVNYKFWNYVRVGNQINVCTNKSSIGFDFLTITEEKY